MTCHEFYSARMAHARHGVAVWTRETTLEVLRLFVEEEGRWPVTSDCRPVHGLPYVDTILRVWQSLAAWRRAGQAAGIGASAPGEGLLAMVRCLRCGEPFRARTSGRCGAVQRVPPIRAGKRGPGYRAWSSTMARIV